MSPSVTCCKMTPLSIGLVVYCPTSVAAAVVIAAVVADALAVLLLAAAAAVAIEVVVSASISQKSTSSRTIDSVDTAATPPSPTTCACGAIGGGRVMELVETR